MMDRCARLGDLVARLGPALKHCQQQDGGGGEDGPERQPSEERGEEGGNAERPDNLFAAEEVRADGGPPADGRALMIGTVMEGTDSAGTGMACSLMKMPLIHEFGRNCNRYSDDLLSLPDALNSLSLSRARSLALAIEKPSGDPSPKQYKEAVH